MAFRVDLHEDPEATVATPFLADDSATVMAPSTPPPIPHPAPPPPLPSTPTPRPAAPPPLPHAAAAPPPAPPSAAAAKERFRPTGPGAPVPQMPGGRAAREEGQEPALLGRDRLLRVPAPRGGSSPASSAAACSWPRRARPTRPTRGSGRSARAQTDTAAAGMTEAYRSRLTPDELEAVTSAIAQSKDATFPSPLRRQRQGHPDRRPDRRRRAAADRDQARQGRRAWKVDDVTLGVE